MREKSDFSKFMIVVIISLITILALLLLFNKVHEILSYGLFFGAGINVIFAILGYSNLNSFTSVIFGIITFVLILIYINKKLKH